MNNKSIRMVVSLSLNALFIAIAVVVVVMFGTKAYTFGNNIFNEKSVDLFVPFVVVIVSYCLPE